MTYEEALKWILANYFDGDDSTKYCVDGCEEVMAMKKAGEALEKQTAKKPKKRVRGVYGDDSNDWLYDEEWDRCPTCRKDKEVYKGWDYCPLCGQALLWEDTE